jgi:rhodanese-related sulfurtransferase
MSLGSVLARLTGGTNETSIAHAAFEKAWLDKSCHVIDVREPHEYAAGHIPEAVNHPLSAFDPAKLPVDKPVVLVCQAGSRSARALQQAQGAGRSDVVHYADGTGGWKARGGRVAM